MVITALLAFATSLACWPDLRARDRLSRPAPVHAWLRSALTLNRARMAGGPAAAILGGVLAGVGGACAAFAVVWLAGRYWRSRTEFHARLDRLGTLAAGIRLFVAELRSGAPLATAAEGAAAESADDIAGVFRNMAVTARLGGDVAAGLDYLGVHGELAGPVGRMARAWLVSERHGIALAELFDSVRRDLDHRVSFLRDMNSALSGPRATAGVLSALPVLGLFLGEALGARPLAVLAHGLPGQILLVLGVGLVCAGVLWTLRITRAVMPS